MRKFLQILTKKLSGGVVALRPTSRPRGYVLLSYLTYPFLVDDVEKLTGHTNYWEAWRMAQEFLERGYAVDVIDWNNTSFRPRENYNYCIDIHSNLERLAPLLDKDCKKIFHITGAHWLFHNRAEYDRLLAIQKRIGKTLVPRRTLSPSHGIEYADYVTMLGNEFTEETYAYAGKKIFRIPISTTHMYPPPEKDFALIRKNFIWFGGVGAAHKGLDLVLEVFRDMPEYSLTIMGKVASEEDFRDAYSRELYQTPHITLAGFVDPGSDTFRRVCNTAIAIVAPSSSEGQSGAVITAMHAGLIPVVSRESGVAIGNDFGIVLPENSIKEIRSAIKKVAGTAPDILRTKAHAAWSSARKYHTREAFEKQYKKFVDMVLGTEK